MPLRYVQNSFDLTTGCLSRLSLPKYGYALYVPQAQWLPPDTSVTRLSPGHDGRIQSDVTELLSHVKLEIDFDREIPCDAISRAIEIEARCDPTVQKQATIDQISCSRISSDGGELTAASQGIWRWSGTLANAHDGIYQFTLKPSSSGGQQKVRNSSFLGAKKAQL
jgi:alpha-1,3-glucan synthase